MSSQAGSARGTRGFLLHVVPALLYVVGIFVGGSLPQPPTTGLDFEYQDKLLHLLAFAGLQVLAWRAVRYLWTGASTSQQSWVACAGTSAVGGLLELWQAALPTRQAEFMDFVADSLGAVLVALWVARSPRPAAGLASSESNR